MNDAEIRAKVDVGDGGGFTRLGNNIKNCDKQVQFLKFKINDLKTGIQQMESMPGQFGKNDILGARSELEKLENQYSKLTKVQEVSSTSLEKRMDKGVKSVKRFGWSLFGIHTMWSLISKSSSYAMSEDEALANKMKASWMGLSSFLSPILEKMTDYIIRAVKYLNVFITALTGVDFLAKAITKSMNKTNKSINKVTKSLSSIDEIQNIGDTSSKDATWVDAFKDIPLDESIVTKLTNLGLKIREIWDKYFVPFFNFLKDNWDTVGKDVVGLILLIGIAFDAATGNWLGLIIKLVGFIWLYKDEIWFVIEGLIKAIWAIIVSLWEMIKGLLNLGISIIKSAVSVIVGIFTTGVELIKGIFNSITSTIVGVINGIKQIFNGLIQFITGVFTGNWKQAWEGVRNIFKGIMDTLWSIIKFPLNLIIDGINALISGLNKIKFDVPDWVPGIGGKKLGFDIPKIPKLNVGTNYVGSDGLAYLHQGEAVIPKKFNSQEYFNSTSNDTVVSRLDTLINTLEEKDMNAYISSKEVGNASSTFQLQQSRIMGW